MSDYSSDTSPLELFRLELEERVLELNQSLLLMEACPEVQEAIEQFMRALHSVKGAASIVVLPLVVAITHRLEDVFAGVKAGKFSLTPEAIGLGFRCIDLFQNISRLPSDQIREWLNSRTPELELLVMALDELSPSQAVGSLQTDASTPIPEGNNLVLADEAIKILAGGDRVVRVEADNLNRIMALSGELLVEAKWLQPFADSLTLLKDRQKDLQAIIESLRLQLVEAGIPSSIDLVEKARLKQRECRDTLSERLGELELYALRTTNLSYRLYREVIGSNMRPFSDAIVAFPRMVRDLAIRLGKQVQLEVVGKGTLVDRDILRKLESPLTHILRNAIDHGIELPSIREARGKVQFGTIRIEAVHRGGMLSITISDDGAGLDYETVRKRMVDNGNFTIEEAESLSDSELCDYLFQPGFSTAASVTELSGRGVGMDVVSAMANDMGGDVRFTSLPGLGSSIHLQLPLTLSVVRTLLVEIAGEPYAFPLARLDQIVAIEASMIMVMEGRECFNLDGVTIGMISARKIMGFEEAVNDPSIIPIVVISDHNKVYGVVVDRYLGEQDLVVRPLDPRLGKVANITAAALMGDGQPILIIDTVDLLHSLDAMLQDSHLLRQANLKATVEPKRILIVDDLAMARDLQSRLLSTHGYKVDKAADGAEALLSLRTNTYDLIVTDVDMPEMDGIELIKLVRMDPNTKQIPIVISSSKGQVQDRLLGLEAGADYYLEKTNFQDGKLFNAIYQLIGAP
jgi:two-component system sensor histidine kinase and response regulator WspE